MKSVPGVVPELILYNATVHTVDPADSVAQALAIGLGRIVAVGSNDDVRRLAGLHTRQMLEERKQLMQLMREASETLKEIS